MKYNNFLLTYDIFYGIMVFKNKKDKANATAIR